ncbi:MAG: hypothetical protein GY938_02715, partial [Ketobacter sp.]|nr:hypothetical protein [Ketobacter sp.]
FDKNRIDATEYQNMTEVWVDADERKVGNARKLPINRMHGTIIDRIGENAYTIQLTQSGKYMPVNVSQIYREIPLMPNATKSKDGLTKAAKAHIEQGRSVRNRRDKRQYKTEAKKIRKRLNQQRRRGNTNSAHPTISGRKRPLFAPGDRPPNARIRNPDLLLPPPPKKGRYDLRSRQKHSRK